VIYRDISVIEFIGGSRSMAPIVRQKHRSRQAHFDLLEGRLLLSGDRPRSPAAEVRTEAATMKVPLKLSGTEYPTSLYTGPPGPNLQFTAPYAVIAQGQVKKVGPVTFTGSYNIQVTYVDYKPTASFPLTQGVATLSDSGGDQLLLSFVGTQHNHRQAHSARYKVNDSVSGQITGGTGQFAGATGSLSGTGTPKGRTGIELKLTLNLQT
jgi:hypothetical protein